jgi:DNA modification methylase
MSEKLSVPTRSTSERRIQVEYLNLGEITLDSRNARIHSKRQLRQIGRSIATFGFNVPVLVDANGRAICGNGRIQAAQAEGIEVIPVIRIEHLTEAEARAFAIADNKLTLNAAWDEEALGETFKELASLNLDFSLDITGFSMGEIDLQIEGMEGAKAKDDDADLVSESASPVSTLGDVFKLGNHILVCGNALKEASYHAVLADERAAMVFTDPPWNLKVDGCISTGSGKTKHREFVMGSGEMRPAQFEAFLRDVTGLMARFSANGAIHCVCMDWRHTADLINASKDAYTELKNICVWVKHNAGLGSFYRSRHEMVLVFKVGDAPHRNNIELGRHGRHRSNVWEYPGVTPFGNRIEEGNLLALHPTVKPVKLVVDAILDCTARGDIVMDPFSGSGSTLIACERTGRRFRGMDLDPGYVDTAVRRWQIWTGQQAVHVATGLTFDELADEREAGHDR